jgi:hypothetical protein
MYWTNKMSNIEKSKSDIEKKERPHPDWKSGDELFEANHDRFHVWIIGKIDDKQIQLLYQNEEGGELYSYGTSDWWKFKNKWKRPIDQDDVKALRMIERKLKYENKIYKS